MLADASDYLSHGLILRTRGDKIAREMTDYRTELVLLSIMRETIIGVCIVAILESRGELLIKQIFPQKCSELA